LHEPIFMAVTCWYQVSFDRIVIGRAEWFSISRAAVHCDESGTPMPTGTSFSAEAS
jgi:hypothetical protein